MQCYLQDDLLLTDISHANTFFKRLKGLLGRVEIPKNEGLLIEPCNSVHTLGMKFSIGVVFLSKENKVIHIIDHMQPGKLSPIIKGSKKVLELHPDVLKESAIKLGSFLNFQ